ncbi:hypothetical protein R3W88_033616 [Solanum pinnatisectum]|uniref:Cytochrome P450 n=1 Tax=Solanum pinnatisectum TaxID=50273 RepID=A0AAV9K2K0_9SOLN|nr:hypothetical protein R3W88_033616 [Solanum pinnatisectum]
MTSIFLQVLALRLVLYIIQVLHNKFMKKKKKFPPGPKGLPIIGNLHMIGKNVHQDLHQIAKKYGPIMSMRFGLVPIIVASSPHAAEQFLKKYDLIFASRPKNRVAQFVAYNQRNLTFAKYGPYWRNMRKLCTLELLSTLKINSFQSMRKQEVRNFVTFINRAATSGVEVDISAKVATLNANMACLMIFGKKNIWMMNLMKGVLKIFVFLFLKFTWVKIIDNVLNIHVMSINLATEKELPMQDMLMASMTLATSIDWIFFELIRHQKVMKKLQKELEQVVGINRMVEESDLEKLEYLEMVIKEDCTIDGFDIPKGSRFLVNTWAIGRDPEVWFEPEKFVPERFIGSNIDLRGRDFQLLPFGSGRRSCPGLQLGLTTVRLVLAQLVHCFDWELLNSMKPNDLDMTEKFGLVMSRARM